MRHYTPFIHQIGLLTDISGLVPFKDVPGKRYIFQFEEKIEPSGEKYLITITGRIEAACVFENLLEPIRLKVAMPPVFQRGRQHTLNNIDFLALTAVHGNKDENKQESIVGYEWRAVTCHEPHDPSRDYIGKLEISTRKKGP